MPKEEKFLTVVSAKRLKREIKNICNSYSHPWDVIAELTQNSVDSIKRWNRQNKNIKKQHEIIIEINQQRKEISVRDTGIGIEPKKLPNLLIPNETDKEGDEIDIIGEKGVGLKFAIFSSNKFALETTSTAGKYVCEIDFARQWKDSNNYDESAIPVVKIFENANTKNMPNQTYTKITLTDVDDAGNLFNLSLDRMIYLLRTKTAIGYTEKKFSKGDLNTTVTLLFTDIDGTMKEEKVPFEYYFPDEFYERKEIINIDEFIKKAAEYSDPRKQQLLSGKCLLSQGKCDRAGKNIHYYAFFVPSREEWSKLSQKAKLFEGAADTDNFVPDVKPGIYISTRGMPTGIEITPPSTGTMGYWSNFFIIFEHDNFSFDLGRKTIPGRTQGIIKDISKEQFTKFSKWKQFCAKEKSPGMKIPAIVSFEKDNQIKEFEKLPNINVDEINFLKQPTLQEAGVVAIFHEFIGAGLIQGYHCLSAGYKHNYDFWGMYRINKSQLGEKIKKNDSIPDDIKMPVVIEFKFDAAGIIDDVEENRKHFEEIDLIVCWDVSEKQFSKFGIDVEPCDRDEIFWFGSNYKLVWPSTYDLGNNSVKYVLSLRRFIEDMKTNKI